MINGIIAQGSTPTQHFPLPFDTSLIEKVSVTYSQNGKTIVTKKTEDCYFDGYCLFVRLNQEDTLAFVPNFVVEAQAKVKLINGDVWPSECLRFNVRIALDKEVF